MAAAAAGASASMSGHIQSQLTRSLERILEDANSSGELKLSGRKLKDFPKTGKYNLNDTVIADLSKNRFGEIPDEVTAFLFLERLLLYHNAIRNVPDTIGMLQSLNYLDLRGNQLTEVPREVCQLPLQVLLLSNNQLAALPKELGRMMLLAELDASANRLTHLPMAIGDMPALRALNLRANQLALLPLQITYLQLEILDVSCNCISSLPLELRHMSSLVVLNLEHNPLVSPPATICVRGRIHIFKYLENQANKDQVTRRGGEERRPLRHHTLPSVASPSTTSPAPALPLTAHLPPAVEGLRHKVRYNVDSGYSTSDGGDKLWASEGVGAVDEGGGAPNSGRSTPSTPSTISPGPQHLSRGHSMSDTPPATPTLGSRISPDGNGVNGDDKSRPISHQQTYRQYKEALRQQRQQDVYRPRGEQISPPSTAPPPPPPNSFSHSTPHSPVANGYHQRSIVSSNPSLSSPNANTPPAATGSPVHTIRRFQTSTPTGILSQTNGSQNHTDSSTPNYRNSAPTEDTGANKRPIQKVIPSRTTKNYSPTGIPVSNSNNTLSPVNQNGNMNDFSPSRINATGESKYQNPSQDGGYIKPVSPVKGSSSFMSHNNVPVNRSNSLGRSVTDSPIHSNGSDQNGSGASPKLLTTSVSYLSSAPGAGIPARLNWNKDERLSFTMKREFDRAKEESELIQQLRSIIENRLKMSLPRDLAPVLADGVVLCHLANHVRPRSVASVHVPSPGQPKLTMARCRRNVDNFLEACRKIGVEEGAVCQPQDILPQEPDCQQASYERVSAISHTVVALLALRKPTAHATDNHVTPPQHQEDLGEASNEATQPLAEEEDSLNEAKDFESTNINSLHNSNVFLSSEEAYDNYSKPYVEGSSKFRNNLNFFQSKPVHRNRYAEDRCISNFNAFAGESEAIDFEQQDSNNYILNRFDNDHYQNNNAESMLDNNKGSYDNESINNRNVYSFNAIEKNKINFVVPLLNEKNKQMSPSKCSNTLPWNNRYQVYSVEDCHDSVVKDGIKYFNNKRTNMNLDIKNNLNKIQNEIAEVLPPRGENDNIISCFCLGTFVLTVILLFFFPLPN